MKGKVIFYNKTLKELKEDVEMLGDRYNVHIEARPMLVPVVVIDERE